MDRMCKGNAAELCFWCDYVAFSEKMSNFV